MKIPENLSSFVSEKFNEKNRYYFLGGILFALFLINYFVLMMPQLRYLMWANPKITTLKKDLQQAKDDIEKIAQYQANVDQLKNTLSTSGSKILSREEIPAILENISVIAKESKIKIDQVVPLKELQKLVLANDEGKFYSLPILLNARGSYHNVGHFFNRIENNKIFMSIADFDMAARNDDPMRHSLNVTIRVFIRDAPDNKGSK